MEVGDGIHRTWQLKSTFLRKRVVLAIRFAQRNYYSDELSSHGEPIEKIYLLLFLRSLLAMRGVVGNLSIAKFTLKLTIDNLGK